jgi:hypothetical protein
LKKSNNNRSQRLGLEIKNVKRLTDDSIQVNFAITPEVEQLFKDVYNLHKLDDKRFVKKIASIIIEYFEKSKKIK